MRRAMQELLQVELIKQLKYRYVRAMDTHAWDLMATCFTEDALFIPHDGKYEKKGRREIVAFFDEVVTPSLVSSHCVPHPEITLKSDTEAYGQWRFSDTIYFTQPNPGVKGMVVTGGQLLRGAGQYYEEYTRGEDEWRISYLTSVRIFTQFESIAPDAVVTIEPALGVRANWPRLS